MNTKDDNVFKNGGLAKFVTSNTNKRFGRQLVDKLQAPRALRTTLSLQLIIIRVLCFRCDTNMFSNAIDCTFFSRSSCQNNAQLLHIILENEYVSLSRVLLTR
jgi:hypothetical protein